MMDRIFYAIENDKAILKLFKGSFYFYFVYKYG